MNRKSISYLGPEGTNSEFAAFQYDPVAELIATSTMTEAILNIKNDLSDFAICAIENSLEGPINEVLDILIDPNNDLKIFDELVLRINHLLVGPINLKIDQVRFIFSHPQALAQCRNSIASLSKNMKLISSSSTATAVESAMKENQSAAIATKYAADLYHAKVIKDDFADSQDNFTRFVIIGKNDNEPSGNDKTSIAFTAQHDRPGSLVEILQLFSNNNLNLTKIESRPTKSMLVTYVFLIDVDAHYQDMHLNEVILEIKKIADWVKIIGSYPKFVV